MKDSSYAANLGKGNFYLGQSSKLTDQLIWMGKRNLNICIYIYTMKMVVCYVSLIDLLIDFVLISN